MNALRERTLLCFALEDEAKDCFDDFHLVFCGIGKVNAAYNLTRAIANWEAKHGQKPDMVLNLGSAGSSYFAKGLIVNCTRFIQRDFDVSALGMDLYATPYEHDIPAHLNHGVRLNSFPEGTCGTGDHFETTATKGPWDLVDMEAYALAKVCLFERVPFGCLKFISDGADGHAATTWEESLTITAPRLRTAVDGLF